MTQLTLGTINADARAQWDARLEAYVAGERSRYLGMAQHIAPRLDDPHAVWARITFAVLSANARFEDAVNALKYAERVNGDVTEVQIVQHRMTPDKAQWVRALPRDERILKWVRVDGESYHAHRERLRAVQGLAYAKASFACALLEPVHADVACVDTHIQRVYLGGRGFRQLSVPAYLAVEDQIRAVGRRHGMSTFCAQWAVWDFARGWREEHDIFGGNG